ncbi:hypothetical protein PFISCL1PPCAC_3771, partial [Pristionchus fissidentatus]
YAVSDHSTMTEFKVDHNGNETKDESWKTDEWAEWGDTAMIGGKYDVESHDSGLGDDVSNEEASIYHDVSQLKWKRRKGRTYRRRKLAYSRRCEREYNERFGKYDPTQIAWHPDFMPADYDETVLREGTIPGNWLTEAWMRGYIDDNIDHKLFTMREENKTFYPAVQKPKREIGYELLEWMPPIALGRVRANSASEEDHKKIPALDFAHEVVARGLRRSKSVNWLDEGVTPGVELLDEEEKYKDEGDMDFFLQIVECESQDELDMAAISFCYTF